MDEIISTLRSFVQNHDSWTPEQFQNIHNSTIRSTVRAAFREPTNFIEDLIQNGTVNDISVFSLAVKEECPFMYMATFATILDLLYSFENQGKLYSHELVQWFRKNGWSFPNFEFENKENNCIVKAKDILYTT